MTMQFIDPLHTLMTPKAPAGPALLSALFFPLSEDGTTLRIRGLNPFSMVITIIHEGIEGVASYDMNGNDETTVIVARQDETLTILARSDGALVGCGIYRIDMTLAETQGMVLYPHCVAGLHLNQCQTDGVNVGHCIDDMLAVIDAAAPKPVEVL